MGEEEFYNEEFLDIIMANDWSELEEDNQPRFFDVTVQPLDYMTIIPIGFIPHIGRIEIVIKKDF